jgi:hypothetical protein
MEARSTLAEAVMIVLGERQQIGIAQACMVFSPRA